ncbi:3D-(3,5/4)-trihydroxycyclohexane-1,2-dione acylhydrolase (decyclizing), partial [Variovorax sp. 2RAF20]
IIGVGTRYSDFTTSSKWLFQHPEVKFLNLNISPCDALKLDGVQLLADARSGLQALSEALADYRSSWGDQPRQAKAQLEEEVDRVYQVE